MQECSGREGRGHGRLRFCVTDCVRMDEDESRRDEDKAFILRLPPDRAREVRQMIADNNFQDIRIHVDPATDKNKMVQRGFKGRTGSFSLNDPALGAPVRLPLTVLDMPTLLETYRTIDGKGGDYVKTADVSQIMVVHETDDQADLLRARRPSGRNDSGITPPTHKITREFLDRTPHFATLLRQRKFNLKSTFHAIYRAERHILRVQNKGGDISNTEIEEVEIEDTSEHAHDYRQHPALTHEIEPNG